MNAVLTSARFVCSSLVTLLDDIQLLSSWYMFMIMITVLYMCLNKNQPDPCDVWHNFAKTSLIAIIFHTDSLI